MFPDQIYIDVNREEQSFCSLFAHALLASSDIRHDFLHYFGLDKTESFFEVYVEAAPLRDYWNLLGNPKKYSSETHMARESVLKLLLSYFHLKSDNLSNPVFWTKTKEGKKSKYASPGLWNVEELGESELDVLLPLKYAFNSQPDILIVTESDVIFIEAKLESKETKYGPKKISQCEIQQLIGELSVSFIPFFSNRKFRHIKLGNIAGAELSWKQIYNWSDKSDLDSYTKNSFLSLITRYPNY